MIDAKQNRSGKPFTLRYRLFLFFLFILFFILAYRAVELVVASPLPPSVMGEAQKVRRGVIFDARGHELAISRDTV
ncbi:MAG TPA: hypothetical protein PLY93_09720, partial [Turneriella sp.]|nr:hypothetical protein [Turneriella sp.]